MAFIVKRDGQGIPVESVSGLEITFSNYGTHLFYKVTNSYFYNIDNDDNEYNLIWNFSTNRWLLSGRGVVATNLTSDSKTIPTTGWIYTTGSGVPILILPAYGNTYITGSLPARSIIIKKNTTFKIPRTFELITTSRAFNSSGNQVGSTNTGNIPDNWVANQATVASVIFANNNSVTSIGTYAFDGCTSLATATLPTNINFTSIGGYTFRGCSALTTITIPNSVTSIGTYAFKGCTSLASITIPNSVTSIGTYAFRDCTNLSTVTFTATSSVSSIGIYAFENCTSLTSITIPNSVTSIGAHIFENCTSLTTATIGTGVTSIGDSAFDGCTSLATVLCNVAQSAFTGSNAFYDTASPLTIRARSTDASWTAGTGLTFQGNTNVTVIKNL